MINHTQRSLPFESMHKPKITNAKYPEWRRRDNIFEILKNYYERKEVQGL